MSTERQTMPEIGDESPAARALESGNTIRQMATSYVTAVAVQKQRSLTAVDDRCREEAALAGESIFYGWSAGGSQIEGPSVKAALIALRNWGNCAAELGPVQETADSWIFTGYFIDLETGVTLARQFRLSKMFPIHGKHDVYRKEDIRFQIGQSKCLRNVILNGLPEWLLDHMVEEAKEGVRSKIEQYIAKQGIEAARDLAIKSLNKYGVTLDMIEAKLERKRGAWEVEDLVLLKGDITALQNGVDSVENMFPAPDASSKPEPPKSGSEAAKAKMKGEPKAEPKPKKKEPTPREEESTPEPESSPCIDDEQIRELYVLSGQLVWTIEEQASFFADYDAIFDGETLKPSTIPQSKFPECLGALKKKVEAWESISLMEKVVNLRNRIGLEGWDWLPEEMAGVKARDLTDQQLKLILECLIDRFNQAL